MKLFGKFSSPKQLLHCGREGRHKIEKLLHNASKATSAQSLLADVDNISNELCGVLDPSALFQSIHPDPEWRRFADETSNEFGSFLHELNTNIGLDESLLKFQHEPTLSKSQSRIIKLFIRDMETQGGVHLSEKSKQHLIKLNMEIDQLCMRYHMDDPMQIITGLREKRRELTDLLGYKTYSHLFTKSQMTENPETVIKFLRDYYREIPSIPLPWYPRFNISLNDALTGLFQICRDVFKLDVSLVEAPVWHPHVKCFKVSSIGRSSLLNYPTDPLGFIYLDLFDREDKLDHPSTMTISLGKEYLNGGYQIPSCCIAISYSGSDLSYDSMSTLFHEFGHALHTILGRTQYQNTSGTRTTLDYIETPSQFMENFTLDEKILKRYWGIENFERVQGSSAKFDVFKGLIDLEMCMTDKPIETIYNEIAKELNISTPFSTNILSIHMTNYASGYYSYLYSKKFSQDLWNKFFKEDPWKNGHKFIEIIKDGGSIDPGEILKNAFRN
jgi:intermediate peptidase